MENLPHDVLSHIFLGSPLTLKEKLVISAISRRLRYAALNLPQLWSPIELSYEVDLIWLAPILARSGNALLDVAVCPYRRNSLDNTGGLMDLDAGKVAEALVPHVARLRSLKIYLPFLSAMAPLLDANLAFLRLSELAVRGSTNARHFPITFSAPELRVVDLRQAYARDWSTVVTPSLKDLTVVNAPRGTFNKVFLDRLLNSCSALHELAFADFDESPDAEPLNGLWTFPHLNHLELCCSSARAVEILHCLSTADVDYVSLSLLEEIDVVLVDNAPHPAIGRLFEGLGEILHFNIQSYDCFMLEFRGGKQRSLRLETAFGNAAPTVWACICDNYGAHSSVKAYDLDARVFYWYHTAFKERPPAAPTVELRLDANVVGEVSSPLLCPTLAKIVIVGHGGDLRIATLERVMLWLQEGYIQCDLPEAPVCVCNVSAEERTNLGTLEERLASIKRQREEDECWSEYATTWITCPGDCKNSV